MNDIILSNQVENLIITIRGERVLLDSDIAKLYEVEAREINQAVKNNLDKFPEGYVLSLDLGEWQNLKSKILTSSWGGKNKLPKAFTEKGLYMLATILKSPKATQTTIAIVETFAKIRELSRNLGELAKKPEKEQQNALMQKSGEIIAEVLGNSLDVSDMETDIEINLALLKFRHKVRRKKDA
ncbi:MAG: ORF6N domain-containing protein [Fibromonadaceae bacterium]|jgi:pantoate kinase|nr:ORF6N domain-containing protein [Fibromonadaceae bacterium]